MKKITLFIASVLLLSSLVFVNWSCSGDEDPGTSTTELLAKKFDTAPVLDGTVEDLWSKCQTLEGTTVVPDAGPRGEADFNGDGSTPVPHGVFDPYTNESSNFNLRAGTHGSKIYFLLEWDDAVDSKDRQSWYFDAAAKRWKGQHKYPNTDDDKYYEDKFSFLWAATDVEGFAANTCYATCHQGLTVTDPLQKAARHYTNNPGELVDMWHWKRVRCTYPETTVDDQKMIYKEPVDAGTNGRTGDEGTAGYHGNSQTLALDGTGDDVKVPHYVIPGATDKYWYTIDEINDGTAKLITGVSSDGVLTYDGGTIDPADGGYEAATGIKRFPSVWVENFTGSKADIACSAIHTGSGWIVEFSRDLDTGNPDDDVKFETTKDFPFGLAIFNNAAIAHEIKSNLILTFEQ